MKLNLKQHRPDINPVLTTNNSRFSYAEYNHSSTLIDLRSVGDAGKSLKWDPCNGFITFNDSAEADGADWKTKPLIITCGITGFNFSPATPRDRTYTFKVVVQSTVEAMIVNNNQQIFIGADGQPNNAQFNVKPDPGFWAVSGFAVQYRRIGVDASPVRRLGFGFTHPLPAPFNGNDHVDELNITFNV